MDKSTKTPNFMDKSTKNSNFMDKSMTITWLKLTFKHS
jgi:hypothetical protein